MNFHRVGGAGVSRQISAGDLVRTPLGREAIVCSFIGDRASCKYVNDHDPVVLMPTLLRWIGRADPDALEVYGVELD